MPLLTEPSADLIIILFTILWGIVIETHFVSRWTILFNVVPLVTLLSSIDMGDTLVIALIGYAVGSIVLALVHGNQ